MATPRVVRRRVSGEPVCGQSFDGQVAATADDGRSNDINGFSTNYGGAGNISGANWQTFARWDNVTVPAGATITAAHVEIVAEDDRWDGAGTRTNIYLNDADDATAPTDRAEHAGKARTTAFTAWDDEEMSEVAWNVSDDITTVVQEVVDRGGWASGQAMMLLFDDDGSDAQKFYRPTDYNEDSTEAWKLHIEFCA